MKIYTHYSDSHEELYEDYFKASLRKIYSKDEVIIRAANHSQTTAEGKFMEQGWLDSMRYKLQVILQAIEENWDSTFIFSDTDIVFYKPFVEDMEEEIKGFDIVCQEDCGSLCAGFFIARGNERVKKLFTEIYNNFTNLVNDQVALNHYKNMVNYKLLDTEEYFTIGNFFDNEDGTHRWDGKSEIKPPESMRVHHANYVVGVPDKVNLINMVRKNYENLV